MKIKKEYYIIDRIEKNILVCEKDNGKIVHIPIDKVDDNGVKEGSILLKKQDKYYLDKIETEKRNKEIQNLMEEMWD